MRKVENRRIRWLTQQEVNKLMKELPPHLQAMASFTLATGLRESNVTQLKWNEINLDKKHALIHADESKSKPPIAVPLNKQAISILKDQTGKNPTYVFTYKGNPVSRCNNHAWLKALKSAGIDDFRWHDLRHDTASTLARDGRTLKEIAEILGHKSLASTDRYAHLGTDHKRAVLNDTMEKSLRL